jgi:glucosamine-6-phosphate deaminase
VVDCIEFMRDKLRVRVCRDRAALGRTAASDAAGRIRSMLRERGELNIVFASAPSQDETLEALRQEAGIDWRRVRAFHMDEYLRLPADAPQAFGQYLRERFFSKLPLQEVHYIDGNAADEYRECVRYADLLRRYPTDLVFAGIGENGHLAFNDPWIADFEDPEMVKVNERLDDACRRQQIHDGLFRTLAEVPERAITLTLPALSAARTVVVVVPGPSKREIVRRTLEGPIGPECPATILRNHPDASLYLDRDSASLLELEGLR